MAAAVRKPTTERRDEIARAAIRIIGERGLSALTTTVLAEEIGLTSGALFRHFATREAILEEAVDHVLGRIDETFPEESLPPLERLLELAGRRARLLASDPGLSWFLRSEQAFLSLPPAAARRLTDVVARSRKFLLDAVREGAADGSIRADIEPELLVIPVMGTIHVLAGMTGAHRHAGRPGAGSDLDRALAVLERLLVPAAGPGAKTRSRRTVRRHSSRNRR